MDAPTTPLVDAVESGDQDLVKSLVAEGASLAPVDNFGVYPPMLASNLGRGEILQVLLEKKAPIHFMDKDGLMPLHQAARSGFANVVEALQGMKDGIMDPACAKYADQPSKKDNQTPLQYACKNCQYTTATILIKSGADVTVLDNNDNTLLHQCCEYPNAELIQLQLEGKGVDMITMQNRDGETPLHYCAYRNEIHLCEQFLAQFGIITVASVEKETYISNFQKESLHALHRALGCKDKRGLTPLLATAKLGFLKLLQMLLNTGHSLLDQADIPKNSETAVVKAEALATCLRGDTVLHMLLRYRAQTSVVKSVCEILKATGQTTGLTLADEFQTTPLDQCVFRKLDDQLRVLLPFYRDVTWSRSFVNLVVMHGNKFVNETLFTELAYCLEHDISSTLQTQFSASTKQGHNIYVVSILAKNYEFLQQSLSFGHHFAAKQPAHMLLEAKNQFGDTLFDVLLTLCPETSKQLHIFHTIQRGVTERALHYNTQIQYKVKYKVGLGSLAQLTHTEQLLRVIGMLDDQGQLLCKREVESIVYGDSKEYCTSEHVSENSCEVEDYRVLLASHKEVTPYILDKTLYASASNTSLGNNKEVMLTILSILEDCEITTQTSTLYKQCALKPIHVLCLVDKFAPVTLNELLLSQDPLLIKLYSHKYSTDAKQHTADTLITNLKPMLQLAVDTLNVLIDTHSYSHMERTMLHLILLCKHLLHTLATLTAFENNHMNVPIREFISLLTTYKNHVHTYIVPSTHLFPITNVTRTLTQTYTPHLHPLLSHLEQQLLLPTPTPAYTHSQEFLLKWTDIHIAPYLAK